MEKIFAKLPAKDGKGMSILEMAEKIADLDKTYAEKLKDQYKKSAGKAAKERWARVDIIAGIIAAEVEEVE